MPRLHRFTVESQMVRQYLETNPNAGWRPVARYLRQNDVHLANATINEITQAQRAELLQAESTEIGGQRVIRSSGEVVSRRYEHLANPQHTGRARVGTIVDTHGGAFNGMGYRVYQAGDVTNSAVGERFFHRSNNSEGYGAFIRVVSSNGEVVQTETILTVDPQTGQPLDWDKINEYLLKAVDSLESQYGEKLTADDGQLSYQLGFVGVEL